MKNDTVLVNISFSPDHIIEFAPDPAVRAWANAFDRIRKPKKPKPPIKKVDQSPFIDKMHLLLNEQVREREFNAGYFLAYVLAKNIDKHLIKAITEAKV